MCKYNPSKAAVELRYERILAWIESGIRTPDLDALEAQDPAAFARSEELARRLLGHLGEARFEPLDQESRRRALEALRSERRPNWRTIVGSLLPRGAAPALALRSGLANARLLFEAEEYDIDLGLTESDGLLGQVLGPGDPDTAAVGHCFLEDPAGDVLPRASRIDADGMFAFDAPVPPIARLVLVLGDVRLVLERVVLREG